MELKKMVGRFGRMCLGFGGCPEAQRKLNKRLYE